MKETSSQPSAPKRENMLINLSFNLLLPILILRKGDDWLGPGLGKLLGGVSSDSMEVASCLLLLAILFPVSYGAYDFFRRRKWNFLSILGALSALLTGGIGLIPELTVTHFAIKEAALPGILGILTVLTLKTKKPLIKLFLYNPEVIRVDLVDQALAQRGTQREFERMMIKCTWLIASSFVLSATLNYLLSDWIVVTEPEQPVASKAIIEIKSDSLAEKDQLLIPVKGEEEREIVLTAISNSADSNQTSDVFRIDGTPEETASLLAGCINDEVVEDEGKSGLLASHQGNKVAITQLSGGAFDEAILRKSGKVETTITEFKGGTSFNDEVGRMMGWSFPIISIPCILVSGYAFWILIRGIKEFAGMPLEEILANAPPTPKK
ncbi:MAG: hypothetical protein HN531_08625 [Opitutae bacterium]|nr:hypothetical protein [Opitutae bacterium]